MTDFGIGKAIDVARSRQLGDTLTQMGMALGTPAYMAPEQAAADPDVDLRADLYAWAVVAYECLSGAHPFPGKRTNQAYITAHMIEQPAPLSERNPVVAPAVATLIMRCLEKNRDQRPDSARAIAEALEAALTATDSGPHAHARPSGKKVGDAPEGPSIAVLPFVNLSADAENEYFSDGITEEIRNLLAQDRVLRVAARSSSFAYKGKSTDPRTSAEQLQVRTLLQGSVRRAGNRVRITAQLVNAADGYQLWSNRFDQELTDIFAVQDEIASAIATTLRAALHESSGVSAPAEMPDESPVAGQRTRKPVNPDAYDEFLKGRYPHSRDWPRATCGSAFSSCYHLRKRSPTRGGICVTHSRSIPDALRWRGKARCALGDMASGLEDLEQAAALAPAHPWHLAELSIALSANGRIEDVRRIRDDLVERSERVWIPPSAIALAQRALGEYDAALRWLERAFQTRDFLCAVFPLEAMFVIPLPGQDRSIRDDPRWTDLVRRVGLMQAPA